MEKTYSLTSENIDIISEEIAEFFKGKKQLTVPPVYGGAIAAKQEGNLG